MKRILIITATLVLCAVITIVPSFAIQSGFYEGQTMVHLLGGQYQVELYGVGDDALVLFDTRDLFWYDNGVGSSFDSEQSSFSPPDVLLYNYLYADTSASVIYNDLTLELDYPDFPAGDTNASCYMVSDRFSVTSGFRLGLHLSPIFDRTTNEYLLPAGDIVNATVTFCALTVDGENVRVPMYRNDLAVGGTYDLTARLQEFFEGRDIQYYWIEYDGGMVVPTFVQDFELVGNAPVTNVHVVDFATDIVYPEYVDYSDFNLLLWISTAVDGFMRAPLFILGDFTVTLGAVLAVSIAVPIFVAFLRRYAGG